MNENKVKFYVELMKALAAFVLGTGAGILTLATTNGNLFLIIFASILCAFSIGAFITLIFYLEKNI